MAIPNRVKHGATYLPNARAIVSRVQRISNDVGLTTFYNALGNELAGKVVTADSYLTAWTELVQQHLDGKLLEFVEANFVPYTKALLWTNNPYFTQVIISRYQKELAEAQLEPEMTGDESVLTVLPEPIRERVSHGGFVVASDVQPAGVAGEPELVVAVAVTDEVFVPGIADEDFAPVVTDEELDESDVPDTHAGQHVIVEDMPEVVEAEVEAVEADAGETGEAGEDDSELANMKLSELRGYARRLGIDVSDLRLKSDVRDAIERYKSGN